MDDVSCCDFDFFLILDTFKIFLTVQFIDIKIKTSCTVWTKNYPFPSPTGKDVSFFAKFYLPWHVVLSSWRSDSNQFEIEKFQISYFYVTLSQNSSLRFFEVDGDAKEHDHLMYRWKLNFPRIIFRKPHTTLIR